MLKRTRIILYICLLLFVFNAIQITVYAETKQTEITTLNKQKDLTVMFTFDKENVDITFISPSGEKLTSNSDGVETAQGNLWSTYRIKDAEPGKWSVEYDSGSNSEIAYSIIEDDYGLWIQYLNIEKSNVEELELQFQADFEGEDIYYKYEIYAISTSDSNAVCRLTDGNARANEEKSLKVNLRALSSDEYVLRLNAFYDDNGTELFDAVTSESFRFDNPNEQSAIEDYKVKVDRYNHICTVDWSEFSNRSHDGYKLIVAADGETIYTSELNKDVKDNSVLFSEGTGNLEVKLAFEDNDIWSKYNIKNIPLEQEFLINKTGEITNSSQVELQYKVEKERLLYVRINDEEGNYKVKDNGVLSFDLKEDVNEIYAELELDDQVYFVVDTNVYYDATPPTIVLYDNLDGKNFYTDNVTILGKMSGGNLLKIEDNVVEVDDNGNFSYEVDLSLGENVIELAAEDANGNLTSRVLTLYRSAAIFNGEENERGFIGFLPMLASVLTSILIIILSAVFMKKKDKNAEKKKRSVFPYIVCDFVIGVAEILFCWQFIQRYRFSNSVKYLEMAEKSVSQAAAYIKWERSFGLLSLIGIVLLVISILLTVFVARKKEKTEEGV